MPRKRELKKKKNGKRLSAYGTKPEDLIRKALNTPPPEGKKKSKNLQRK